MVENKKNIIFFFAALLFVVLAAVGGARAYSPVPFWDMWDGYLGFYTKVSDGEWGAWWAQHNEHRIVLARIFFWLDLALFDGRGWFLLIVNYSLLLMVCWLFLAIWKEVEPDKEKSWIGYFLMAWLFWWLQKDNLEWGFQSQFILAQLLPLSSFYFLHLACLNGRARGGFFVFSIACGILSIGTMANGVLALPLMFLFVVILRIGWQKVVIVGLLAIVFVGSYFYEYKSPEGHGSLTQAIIKNPIDLIQYTAVYLGGPFSFGNEVIGIWMATIAGFGFILLSVVLTFRFFTSNGQDSLQLSLLMFIVYVGGTAFGAAGGRSIFGIEQALASRYMTPTLMAWAAIFILSYNSFSTLRKYSQPKLWVIFGILLMLMIPQQLEALKPKSEILYERNIAVLALELGISDQNQIHHVFPSASWALSIAKKPIDRNYSIFGMEPFIDLAKRMNKNSSMDNKKITPCNGSINSINYVDQDVNYLKIAGSIFGVDEYIHDDVVEILTSDKVVVGYGLTRHQYVNGVHEWNDGGRLFFVAYVLSDIQGKEISIYDKKNGCIVNVEVPFVKAASSWPKVVDHNHFSIKTNISIANVVGRNDWLGQDFQKTAISGMKILGTYIKSDADVGSIVLKVGRGDKLYYRSGPNSTRQTLEFTDLNIDPIIMPASVEWQLIDFSNHELPDFFLIKLTDAGTGWGEWSALALNDSKR